ncbi:MgtC/SapB family protein [Enterococcus asini]|uniref:MgtC/SapB family protein n=1 Tax=Enterococcus TaxID=1350 RepID=UPI00288E629B|nr:MgtC/SapB family protein [Enterococcus asini]MDT2757242.1 MgtC/SapB family protein [Enterococcus asini]
MEEYHLHVGEIVLRLVMAVVMGGAVGYEREFKKRPAGMKTHILVCLGAALIAMIQMEISWSSITFALDNPKMIGVMSADNARLIAQIVSGIGFLGAGTIIVNKDSVTGLTTAASVWAIAAVGIATGMGFYALALISWVCVLGALTFVSHLMPLPRTRRLLVEMEDWDASNDFIQDYLEEHQIKVEDMDFEIKRLPQESFRTYSVIYTLTVPRGLSEKNLLLSLSENPNILKIRLIN